MPLDLATKKKVVKALHSYLEELGDTQERIIGIQSRLEIIQNNLSSLIHELTKEGGSPPSSSSTLKAAFLDSIWKGPSFRKKIFFNPNGG